MNEWLDKNSQENLWKSGRYEYQSTEHGVLLKYPIIGYFLKDRIRILDVGAGHGLAFFYFSKKIKEYYYLEISESAFSKFNNDDPRVFKLCCDFDDLVLDKSYDVVLFLGFRQGLFNIDKMKEAYSKSRMMVIERKVYPYLEFDIEKYLDLKISKKIKYEYPEMNRREIYIFERGE